MRDEMAELVSAASRGDRRAAGEYFAQNLHVLSVVARRVAGRAVDPDDLLSDAILAVLTKWSQGNGPTEFVNAYVVQTMRNRLKDELKSPRSRVVQLDDSDEHAAEQHPGIRRAELGREIELVRRALSTLPADQRAVITETVVRGRKPRELEQELGRPSSSIYSLSRRARLGLRRAVLRLMLEEDAPPECRAAARHLPDAVADTPDETRGGLSAEHYRTCARCRRVWAGFATLSGGLGIVALAVVGDLTVLPATPAEASEDGPDDHDRSQGRSTEGQRSRRGQDSRSSSQQPQPHASPAPPGSPSPGSAVASAARLPVPATARAQGVAPEVGGLTPSAPTSAAQGGTVAASAPAAAESSAKADGRGARMLTRFGLGALVAGVAVLAVLGYAFLSRSLWFAPDPTAHFDVSRVQMSSAETAFVVEFEVRDNDWSVESMMMEFGARSEIDAIIPPEGWQCTSGPHGAICATADMNAGGGVFVVRQTTHAPLDEYTFVLSATTAVGADVVGTVEWHDPS